MYEAEFAAVYARRDKMKDIGKILKTFLILQMKCGMFFTALTVFVTAFIKTIIDNSCRGESFIGFLSGTIKKTSHCQTEHF